MDHIAKTLRVTINVKPFVKKNFPKPFQSSTIFKKNGYPQYKRTDNFSDNHTYQLKTSKKIIPVDNSMVVPYNKFLLEKYKCHINVEYCASIQSIKYIFDYIHKGSDRAFCALKKMMNKKTEYMMKSLNILMADT